MGAKLLRGRTDRWPEELPRNSYYKPSEGRGNAKGGAFHKFSGMETSTRGFGEFHRSEF